MGKIQQIESRIFWCGFGFHQDFCIGTVDDGLHGCGRCPDCCTTDILQTDIYKYCKLNIEKISSLLWDAVTAGLVGGLYKDG